MKKRFQLILLCTTLKLSAMNHTPDPSTNYHIPRNKIDYNRCSLYLARRIIKGSLIRIEEEKIRKFTKDLYTKDSINIIYIFGQKMHNFLNNSHTQNNK